MKERIFTGWTFQRVIFSILGIVILIQSIVDKQWFGIAFGIYLASMGLFAMGCTGGNCYVVNRNLNSDKKTMTTKADTEYEEVK